MPNDRFQEFAATILASSALQDQLKTTNDRAAFVKTFIHMAAAHGYQFSPDEVEAKIETLSLGKGKELTDQDLALVAGGLPKNIGTIINCDNYWTFDYGPCV